MSTAYRYINKRGQLITGTAALLHQIKEDGGLKKHYHKIIDKALDEIIEDSNKTTLKNNLKLIKGYKTA